MSSTHITLQNKAQDGFYFLKQRFGINPATVWIMCSEYLLNYDIFSQSRDAASGIHGNGCVWKDYFELGFSNQMSCLLVCVIRYK